LNRTLSHEDSEEIRKGVNTISNEQLNEYELGFGLGLSPNRSDEHLLGQILANELVELVRTRWPDWPVVAGVLGLGWLGWAMRKVGQARPTGWILAQELISNKKFFFFFFFKSIL
jgi:hypothetical protein